MNSLGAPATPSSIASAPKEESPAIRALAQAVRFVTSRCGLEPTIGVVLGSGLGAFAEAVADGVRIPYAEIPSFPTSQSRVVGHKGELILGRLDGVSVAVLAGRIHSYEGYPLRDVVFPVRLLGRLGVRTLILTNAAGAINASFRPGDLMVIDDHINLLGNPLTGPNEDELGPRFPDMSEAYDPELRDIASRACLGAGVPLRHGVYVAMSGPSYETPAEIRMARALGADAVGMSTVPEVIAARHMGLRVLGLSCITNMAAGVTKQRLDHKEVLAVGEQIRQGLLDVLGRVVREAARS